MFKNNKPILKYFTKLVIKSGSRLPMKNHNTQILKFNDAVLQTYIDQTLVDPTRSEGWANFFIF